MRTKSIYALIATVILGNIMSRPNAHAVDSATVKAMFTDPSRDYSTAPLWVWNDMLTEQQIRDTLRDLAGQKVMQAFVHPRPGLMTPYLSEDWFRLWQVALDEAERLDMNIWIYDENSYPSGFAGGWVPELMPESRGRRLSLNVTDTPGKVDESCLAIYTLTGNTSKDVTQKLRAGQTVKASRFLRASVQPAGDSPWTGGGPYVDLLHPGVTEKFIEVTMEAYRRHMGDQFGKRIPGWFTDEPHLAPAGGLHWSVHLPQLFQQRWGYDLIENLPSLHLPVGDWRRVRHNYYQVLLEEFIARWAQPCYEYCEKHNLEFTGHYWEHGWPRAGHGGDNMAMYAWHQRPSIDNLMNQYSEGVSGQFGNTRTVKELSSVANQLGRQRTLCETYGAGGWDLRFEDMKRIGDWLYVLGVNTLNEHLSYVTIRGTRKRDHPQSFSYHTPWWKSYHVMAEYFTRLSVALSQGQQINRILVLEPTTSAWMYQPGKSTEKKMMDIGHQFQALVNALERAQVPYDLGCEDIMARHGSVASDAFVVGQRSYHTVVLPPLTENLNAATAKLLRQYVHAGGRVLCCGPAPTYIDGASTDRIERLAQRRSWQKVDITKLPKKLRAAGGDAFAIDRPNDDQGILFHQRRHLDDGELVFLVNTSIKHASSGTIHSVLRGAQEWLPYTGETKAYSHSRKSDGIMLDYHLPPCGSLLLFLSRISQADTTVKAARAVALPPTGPLTIKRMGPNVLPLDFVDVTAGGETKKNLYCYPAAQFAFKKNGMEKNPWDHAVQFRDNIISTPFPDDSGFDMVYRFHIEQRLPDTLEIVIERPDLYQITCNDQPVQAKFGQWWLDRAFGRIDLTGIARLGENTVHLKATPMTVFHEIEPAYVIGEFSLHTTEKGYAIAPPKPVTLGPWKEQGLPFYSQGMAYQQTYTVSQLNGRYIVQVPSWYGSVAEIRVNGRIAGHLVSRPWEVDVTEHIQTGENTIEIEVIGTLKNTLGPHHGTPVLGKAWPWDFRQAPDNGPPAGEKYHTVDYGLYAPPSLQVRR
jgi:hypothetical protein